MKRYTGKCDQCGHKLLIPYSRSGTAACMWGRCNGTVHLWEIVE